MRQMIFALAFLAACQTSTETIDSYSPVVVDAASDATDSAKQDAKDSADEQDDAGEVEDTAQDAKHDTHDSSTPDTSEPDVDEPETEPEDSGHVDVVYVDASGDGQVIDDDSGLCGGGLWQVLDLGIEGSQAARGQALNTTTGKTWTRYVHGYDLWSQSQTICNGIGMRLPTKAEALQIIDAPTCAIASKSWQIWTRDVVDTWSGTYVVVGQNGYVGQQAGSASWQSLCVAP